MGVELTVRQLYQMAQQRLALEIIARRTYFLFSLLESVLDDRIQHPSYDSHRFNDSVFQKLPKLPNPTQPISLGDHGLCGQEGVGKFVRRVISGGLDGSGRRVIETG